MCRLALCPAPEQTFRIAAFLPASHTRMGVWVGSRLGGGGGGSICQLQDPGGSL